MNRAHGETQGVKVLLENMSGQGSALGSTFEELRCPWACHQPYSCPEPDCLMHCGGLAPVCHDSFIWARCSGCRPSLRLRGCRGSGCAFKNRL